MLQEFLVQNWHWALLALASGLWWLIETIRSATDTSRVTPAQAVIMVNRQDAVLIDIRSEADYRKGHLPNAISIPADRIPEDRKLEALRSRHLILYCDSGLRSATACKKLRAAGFPHVYNLEGGIAAWQKAGLPLESETQRKKK